MVDNYHEPAEELSQGVRDDHRAIRTVIEELEAIDWYHQRIDRAGDEELKEVLTHLRNEEIEHMAMMLEWLRRRFPEFEQQLQTYLFTSRRIVAVEEAAESAGEPERAPDILPGDLRIGKFEKGD